MGRNEFIGFVGFDLAKDGDGLVIALYFYMLKPEPCIFFLFFCGCCVVRT